MAQCLEMLWTVVTEREYHLPESIARLGLVGFCPAIGLRLNPVIPRLWGCCVAYLCQPRATVRPHSGFQLMYEIGFHFRAGQILSVCDR